MRYLAEFDIVLDRTLIERVERTLVADDRVAAGARAREISHHIEREYAIAAGDEGDEVWVRINYVADETEIRMPLPAPKANALPF